MLVIDILTLIGGISIPEDKNQQLLAVKYLFINCSSSNNAL
jgi:hypothetical protein